MTEGIQSQDPEQHFNKDYPAVILNATDIWHSYDGQSHVLRGVNVELREGLFTMVLGRSASGKTTLVKILANVIKPTRGQVSLKTIGSLSSRRIAYIPQNLGLVRNLTALDNVLTGALGYTSTLRSLVRKFDGEVYDKARRILSDLGIGDKANKRIWHLSGGERQRVAIARALIQNPQIILADEFVSQLDPVTSMEILDIMKKLIRSKISFLITTHDVTLVKKYADRVIVMKNGQILREHVSMDFSLEEILKEIK